MELDRAQEALRSQIFAALRQDGRASFASIADTLGSSRRQVTQIVQRAVELDELRITVSISPDLLGHKRFAYAQLLVVGPLAPARDALIAMPETTFVAEISGEYTIDAELRVGADPHLRQVIDRIKQLPHVAEVHLHHYESIEVNAHSPIRTKQAGFAIDDADRAIVRRLRLDGRASYRELGLAAKISPSGARLRLNRLMEHDAVKVIGIPVRGTRAEVPILGVGVRVNGPLAPALAQVRLLDPEFLAVTVGAYDLIVTLSASTNDELLALTDRLRSLPQVARITTWANLRILKEQYGEGGHLSSSARIDPGVGHSNSRPDPA